MLLKNFYLGLRDVINNSFTSSIKTINNGTIDISNIDSSARPAFCALFNSSGTKYLKCGTGTTPATADDYCIETINTNLAVSNITTTLTASNNLLYTLSFSVTNNSSSTISMSEFVYGKSKNSDFWEHLTYIGYRYVFSTPIEIAAGQTKNITVTIDLT